VRVASRWRPPGSGVVGLTMSLAFISVCGLVACSLITGSLPAGTEPFVPPAVYTRWWVMTEACSGRSGDLGAVHWYRVPGSQFVDDGRVAAGAWNQSGNRILLAQKSLEQGPLVRHEMLHALLQSGRHPRSQFLGACASLVVCQGICLKDAGPWEAPRQDFVVLPPESLDVASRADLLPRESDGQRWFTLEVTVRNSRASAVVVAAPGDAVTPPTFGYDLLGPSGGTSGNEIATDSSTLFFQPLEAKQWLFEFRVTSDPSDYHVTPGMYLVRGAYARHWTAYDSIAVSQ
jgi:hypothetical protein